MACLLTIVTVTRNDAEGLRATLASLASQEGVDWSDVEHVVIDGASTDATPEVFSAHRLPVSTMVSAPDRGVYDAMDKGLGLAAGEYVQFLNSGDRLADPRALVTCLEVLSRRPVWLVAGGIDEHGGRRPEHVIANLPHRWWRHALGLQPHCHQATFFRCDLLRALGGHEETFGFVADFDAVLRFGVLGRPSELARVVVRYAGGGVSEERMDEIPQALARVRAERLGLHGWAERLNRAWASLQRRRVLLGRVLGR